nr:uncharacterized protein [Tanacetum cinerariifolium]
MTGNLKLLINFVWKFMGTVRFGNDHVAAILGFDFLEEAFRWCRRLELSSFQQSGWLVEDLDNYHLKELHYSAQCLTQSYHFKELRCSAQCLTQLRIFKSQVKSGDDASFLGSYHRVVSFCGRQYLPIEVIRDLFLIRVDQERIVKRVPTSSHRVLLLQSRVMQLHKLFQLAYDVHTCRMIYRLVIILEGDMCTSGRMFEYWDCGDAVHQSPYCAAMLWYEEQTTKSRSPRVPKFSICCSEGKVQLLYLEHPPQLLQELMDYNGWQYNLPTASEIAALVPRDGNPTGSQDVIIEERGGEEDQNSVKRISELHPSFMALQYPLLFPYEEDGFQLYTPLNDEMAICRWVGPHDLFLTMTCNPNWPEIQRHVEDAIPGQPTCDRSDVIVKVFKIKLDELMKDIRKSNHFGRVKADDKIFSPDQVDHVISAELPSEVDDSIRFEAVRSHMMYGPCGELNPSNSCMSRERGCQKGYPKAYCWKLILAVMVGLILREQTMEEKQKLVEEILCLITLSSFRITLI